MLRRSILQVASRGSGVRVPLRTNTQVYLSSRRAFSVSPKNAPPKPEGPKTKSNLPKIVTGGLAVGSVLFAAYYYGVLDKYLGKEQQRIGEYVKAGDKNTGESSERNEVSELSKTSARSNMHESGISSSKPDHGKEDVESHSEISYPEVSIKTDAGSNFPVKDTAEVVIVNPDNVKERDLPDVPQGSMPPDEVISNPHEESLDLQSPEVKPDEEHGKAIYAQPLTPAQIKTEIRSVPMEEITAQNTQEVVQNDGIQAPSSLLDDYYIKESSEDYTAISSSKHKGESSKKEDSYDNISKDRTVILDLLQAIHAAEEMQAHLDARAFAEEKRAMEEKYEKELKDARVRELMYAEREAILDKEIIKERVKATAALKSLQEKLEEKLRTELEQKETEVEEKLKKMQDIAKAELAAAIASEKASQIEKMAEANLNINALCMAFYARSEEARQSHSIHKLALGALAVEDSLAKGLPIQKEIEALHTNLEGDDKDSLIALVLSSLPKDTQKNGTDTVAQLNHKFDALKGTLRHFSLIPHGGGGTLAHTLAYIASSLKFKEVDQSGDGIESLINKVENLLAQGEICAAADALENGVKGSQAAEVVADWVKQARNRAITEQALSVLHSYATTVSLT